MKAEKFSGAIWAGCKPHKWSGQGPGRREIERARRQQGQIRRRRAVREIVAAGRMVTNEELHDARMKPPTGYKFLPLIDAWVPRL